MDVTMRTPRAEAVLREQFSLIASTPHKEWIAVALLAVLMLSGVMDVKIDLLDHQVGISGFALTYIFALPCAAVWALGVWFREGPTRRDYHWAMPVERRLHALLRVAAGAGWLLLGLLGVLLVGTVLLLVRHSQSLDGVMTPAIWLSFLVGPLTIYFLSSWAALVSDRPLVWILVVAAAVKIVWIVSALNGVSMLREFIEALLFGPNSLGVMISLSRPVGQAVGMWAASLSVWLSLSVVLLWLAAGRRSD